MTLTKPRLGIIGGGQLGKMMALAAKEMDIHVTVLDPTSSCPAHSVCDRHIVADFFDAGAYRLLAEQTDVCTYEFEHINAHALLMLEQEGYSIYPTASSLLRIQDKRAQKQALADGGILVADFAPVLNEADIRRAAGRWGYPVVAKTATGGYDGKGNFVIYKPEEIPHVISALSASGAALLVERMIPFCMEVSVLACRSIDGQVAVYPVAENIHQAGILCKTIVPARISDAAAREAMRLAACVMDIFKGVGMFCVELFITDTEQVLVNEVAPRPHNSGHYTIEACLTSQFAQHVRAVCGLPLGSQALHAPVCMRNLLGEDGATGTAVVSGLAEALAVPGVSVHLYGKENTASRRKMGHLTAVADTIDQAEALADRAFACMKITTADKLD